MSLVAQGALPAKGKEYPGLGCKGLQDKPLKTQPAMAQVVLGGSSALHDAFEWRPAYKHLVVLGIKPDADTNEVNRAYNKKKYEHRNTPSMLSKVEAAHGQLMLNAFNARVKGQKTVPKEIKYADKEQLFPWRPKRWDATPKIIMIFGGLQLALMAFAFQAPNLGKAIGCEWLAVPHSSRSSSTDVTATHIYMQTEKSMVVVRMLLGIAGNVMKQNAIFPPPNPDYEPTEEEAGRAGRNFVRGAMLGLFATFAGITLFSAPEYVQQLLKVQLPIQAGTIISLKVAGSAICNWIMTSYYY
ncbi:hypothetical protein QJQ45_027620 [Haematococcus lacustris]|nr:hypothetical protein QJQ45_027620 [Haematococcus lacustris]